MNSSENRGEWTKFVILVVILIGTIVVVALLRPLIFGRIVPAVMGEGIPTSPQEPNPAPIPTETPVILQPSESVGEPYPAVPVGEGTPAVQDNQAFIPLQNDVGTADTSAAYPAAPATESQNAPNAITHQVKPGESLTKIALQYGVTLQSIIEANKLTNPNHIEVGTTLIIIVPNNSSFR